MEAQAIRFSGNRASTTYTFPAAPAAMVFAATAAGDVRREIADWRRRARRSGESDWAAASQPATARRLSAQADPQ